MFTPKLIGRIVGPAVTAGLLSVVLSVALLTGCATAVVDETSILPLDTLDQKPKIGERPRPMMPSLLRGESVSGRVLVEFVVDSGGNVSQARVVEATPPEFADTGRRYFEQAKFTPGQKDGRAVATRMRMPFIFHQNAVDPTADFKPTPSLIAASDIVSLEALDQKPVATFQMRPAYPFAMRRNGVAGRAVVEFIVDAQGSVQGAQAVEFTHPDFGPAAAAAVSKWKYRPGTKNGQPVNTRMRTPIVFTLNEEKK